VLTFLAQVLPVLVFLLAISLVAEVCDRAGLFDVAGHALVRAARGRVLALWAGLVLLCLVTTSVLSLDTTAVLVAPVAIAMARRGGVHPLPFAVTAVWLANTGSLLLPVSNLTNLLSGATGSPLAGSFTAHAWAPALAAAGVTVVLVVCFWPSVVRGRYTLPPAPRPHDRVLLSVCAVVVTILAVLFACGVSPALPTVAAAVLLACVFAARRPQAWRRLTVPWRMALAVLALFLVVKALGPLFLDNWLASALGHGDGPLAWARVAAVGALGANGVNNLPAFLALHPGAADSAARSVALLVGVNAGSVVTPWGSLATLLWLWRCRAAGVEVPLGPHVLRSLVVAVAAVAAGIGALVLVG